MAAHSDSGRDFSKLNCESLREYLKARGISATGYCKQSLVRLATCASGLSLETDPDSSNVDVASQVKSSLQGLNFPVLDPFTLPFSDDFSSTPMIGLIDVFNYLIDSRTDFDKKATKAYKSYEDYRLFHDGHVLELKCWNNERFCCYQSRVKPTQRQKTYILTDAYKLWIIADRDGDIHLAYCQCPAGSDGACRHIAAALYAIEDHEVKSVTDGPAVWVRRNTACEEAERLNMLPQIKARYDNRVPRKLPSADNFDPRAYEDRVHTAEKEALFAELLSKELPDAAVLECLVDSSQDPSETTDADEQLLQHSVAARTKDITSQGDTDRDFDCVVDALCSEQETLQRIEKATRGQNNNPLWYVMRQGRVTASDMKRVCSRHTTLCGKPDTDCTKLVDHILGKRTDFDTPALAWGRKKEKKAREHYCRVEKKKHKNVTLSERGLQISSRKPFLGCSVDGLVSCSCTGHSEKLIEIKCPYALRELSPKDAARQRGCELNVDNGSWSLNERSQYFHQIQTQLFVYGLSECDLVIYTTKGIIIVPVQYSEKFAVEFVRKAEDFYKSQICPALLCVKA
ncbi:hypothetical protein V1264_007259 [Littorina saxatilis]|uniref:SWIM-type domain-containing protein n=1 Tax=Littorina saxatilis TaxID=31220 RepID=A0AAN9AUY7_9CAEN